MNTAPFYAYYHGSDVVNVFNIARYNHGFGGIGAVTIATKDRYTVIQSEPTRYRHARQPARQLIKTQDPRFNEASAPAGAIPIIGGRRVHTAEIAPRPGGYPDLATAAVATVRDVLLDGEQIVWPNVGGCYERDSRGRVVAGTVIVPTRGANVHTGWLFFGWATL